MDKWRLLIRDIAALGIAGYLAVREANSPDPKGDILLLIMGLLVPGSIHYVKALLSEPGAPESSPPPEPSERPSSSPRAEGSGD